MTDRTIVFTPSRASGSVLAPPSKSAAHRALICAGLCTGESVVHNVDLSEDILASIDCLRALGVSVEIRDGTAFLSSPGPFNFSNELCMPCRESGSTLRFFLPIVWALGRKARFTGSEKLLSRPLQVYEKICREHGISFVNNGSEILTEGKLIPDVDIVDGSVSSQFISGLLFALPLLDSDSGIIVRPPFESKSYVNLTIETLKAFGVKVFFEGTHKLSIPGGQVYRPLETVVEGDWSNAAFFEGFNLLGGKVSVSGLNEDSLQPDRVCRELFAQIKNGSPKIDLSECPDLGPVCMALAAAKHGAVFTGISRLRFKESDRAAVMEEELQKFSVSCTLENNLMVVRSEGFSAPRERLSGHNDHRVVMALSLLLSRTGGQLCGAQAVSKSLPDFFDRIRALGIDCKEI